MFRSLPILREDFVEDSSANRRHRKPIIGWSLFAKLDSFFKRFYRGTSYNASRHLQGNLLRRAIMKRAYLLALVLFVSALAPLSLAPAQEKIAQTNLKVGDVAPDFALPSD